MSEEIVQREILKTFSSHFKQTNTTVFCTNVSFPNEIILKTEFLLIVTNNAI